MAYGIFNYKIYFINRLFDENNKNFGEPYLPHNKIGIMHLAAGIWNNNKDMRTDKNVEISIQTVQGNQIQKSLRYGH